MPEQKASLLATGANDCFEGLTRIVWEADGGFGGLTRITRQALAESRVIIRCLIERSVCFGEQRLNVRIGMGKGMGWRMRRFRRRVVWDDKNT
jgi:hypothetical protein